MLWTGSIWLRIGTSWGLLLTRCWTFEFIKMLGCSWVAAQFAASQEGLSSVSNYFIFLPSYIPPSLYFQFLLSFSPSFPPSFFLTCFFYFFVVDCYILASSADSLPKALHYLWSRVRSFACVSFPDGSRDSAVGIATGYGLEDWEVGVWVPVWSRIFTSPCRPDRHWGPPNLLHKGYRELFPGGKAAGAWSWPLTSN
jgi:hypothetical protein